MRSALFSRSWPLWIVAGAIATGAAVAAAAWNSDRQAETTAIARSRGVQPILLLDDVSSELDRERTEALFVRAHPTTTIHREDLDPVIAADYERALTQGN